MSDKNNKNTWTSFGKVQTCLYKIPQLAVHVRPQTMAWIQVIVEDHHDMIVLRNITGKRKKSAASKVPVAQEPNGHSEKDPSFFYGERKTFRSTFVKLFL